MFFQQHPFHISNRRSAGAAVLHASRRVLLLGFVVGLVLLTGTATCARTAVLTQLPVPAVEDAIPPGAGAVTEERGKRWEDVAGFLLHAARELLATNTCKVRCQEICDNAPGLAERWVVGVWPGIRHPTVPP